MMATSQTKKPKKGDRIEIKRTFYSHWALYIGDDKVIHMRGVGNASVNSTSTTLFSICGVKFDKAEVAIDEIWDVIGDDKAYVNNSRDSTWNPFDEAGIIREAMKYIGHVKYSVIFANCECFVNWCRYGKWISDQGDTPEIMDEIVTTAKDMELEVNEDNIEELIMEHEIDLTAEELQEILNE
ncbi:Phospholipase A and acyltransferase 3 [Bulinus truncatus]|nr:Phospholipase A and acyltransferase 3 [Bulinus truncatus]